MEVDRIRKVADMIEAHPEHFHMRWWLRRDGNDIVAASANPRLIGQVDLLSCGTTACIGGWAVGLWPAEVGRYEDVVAAAAHILGLSLVDCVDLCSATVALHSPDDAAAHLRGMADHYEAASA